MPPHQQVQEHIDLIAQHEQDFLERRTASERAGDIIADFAGSLRFVIVHLAFFAVWMLFNSVPATHRFHFDPYPYAMLDTIVAMEAILLASFILMRQSRTSRRAEEREHLMLQILLLTEKETTALLQMNREMAGKMGLQRVAHDRDFAALSQDTPINEVAENIKESLDNAGQNSQT
jgi:uncharacterized membrane protein